MLMYDIEILPNSVSMPTGYKLEASFAFTLAIINEQLVSISLSWTKFHYATI